MYGIITRNPKLRSSQRNNANRSESPSSIPSIANTLNGPVTLNATSSRSPSPNSADAQLTNSYLQIHDDDDNDSDDDDGDNI